MAALGLLLGMIGIDSMSGLLPLRLRDRRAGRRHRHRAGGGGAVRRSRRSCYRPGRPPGPMSARPGCASCCPRGRNGGRVRRTHRPRHRARISHRHPSGAGPRHLVALSRTPWSGASPTSRALRPRRRRRRRRSRVGQQLGHDRRVRADAGARPALGRRPGHHAGGDDDPRHRAGPPAHPAAAPALLGGHRQHVRGQRRAADPEPAAGRALREYPAYPVFVPVSGHSRFLPRSACTR